MLRPAAPDTLITPHVDKLKQNLIRYTIHDPYAFLIESPRLCYSERIWQRVFVAMPVLSFAFALTLPISIAYNASLYKLSSDS